MVQKKPELKTRVAQSDFYTRLASALKRLGIGTKMRALYAVICIQKHPSFVVRIQIKPQQSIENMGSRRSSVLSGHYKYFDPLYLKKTEILTWRIAIVACNHK